MKTRHGRSIDPTKGLIGIRMGTRKTVMSRNEACAQCDVVSSKKILKGYDTTLKSIILCSYR